MRRVPRPMIGYVSGLSIDKNEEMKHDICKAFGLSAMVNVCLIARRL